VPWSESYPVTVSSGVTTRGEVWQLPQGAKRQGALWADRLFALLLNAKDRTTLTRSPPAGFTATPRSSKTPAAYATNNGSIIHIMVVSVLFFLLLAEIARLQF